MKHLKLFFLGFATIFALGLVSCDDDDNGGGDAAPCDLVECPPGFTCVEVDGVANCEPDGTNCITIPGGFLEANTTWTADNCYILGGKVVVPDGITLTIEAGTIVKGAKGAGTLATALVVARGGTLIADGSADAPIVFTSVDDDISTDDYQSTISATENGLWGGVIILGNAPISVEAGDEAQIEGIPADEEYGRYGGNNAGDNSGVIRYISIRYGGASIGEGNEINGLTLGGVGTGTTVEWVEVVSNQDDGIECFGGTVNIDNALVYSQGDDAYDIDQAYSGTINNFIYIGGADSDHGLEIDGPEGAANGGATLRNGTLKLFNPGGEYADFRDGAQGTYENMYFFNGSESSDFELDDNQSSMNFTNGTLSFGSIQFNTSHLSAGNRTCADIMKDTSDDPDSNFGSSCSIVSAGSVGANTSGFEWTQASKTGALDF